MPPAGPSQRDSGQGRPRAAYTSAPAGAEALRQPNPFSGLSESERRLVLGAARRRRFQPGALLFRQGDAHLGIFIVETGVVRTFYDSFAGRQITLAYWGAGNLVGAPQVFGGGAYAWSCEAVTASEVLAIRGDDMRSLVEKVPTLAVGIVEALVFKVQWLSELVQMLGTQSVTERLAHLLDTLSRLYGVPGAEGIVIGAPFTHEDLANMVGASRQWVTMTLDGFQARGIIRIQKRRIVILQPERLKSPAT